MKVTVKTVSDRITILENQKTISLTEEFTLNVFRWALVQQDRAQISEAKLAELEKQANDQKPFMYGIMTANGDAHFEDFCVSSDPGLLEDVIWEWNNTLADNEPKNRVVALFTRTAPAINLAELVPERMTPEDVRWHLKLSDHDDGPACRIDHAEEIGAKLWNDCRAAILRNIEEA